MRAAVLLLLAEEPRHGYQIITEIGERSEDTWHPSPGAVYPAIAQLQDEGLVSVSDDGGRRLASLTDAGRVYVEEHRDELGTPWELPDDPRRGTHRELRTALHALHGAVEQVGRTSTPEQATKAVEILATARRELYLLLAE
jgi:DNA-binding PadR family transcriptional regulator